MAARPSGTNHKNLKFDFQASITELKMRSDFKKVDAILDAKIEKQSLKKTEK